MRQSFILTCVIFSVGIFLFFSCQAVLDDIEEGKVIPEVHDSRFAKCYYDQDLAKNKCDSVLTSLFGVPAQLSMKLNDELSFIGCDEGDDLEKLSFGDEKCCLPRTYDLVYDVIVDKDTIYQVVMVAGSEMKFDFISEDEKKQLLGYALLLDGKIKFDYRDLKNLMKNQKMNPSNYELELIRDTLVPFTDVNAFYWEVSDPNGSDEYQVTRINATTGRNTDIRL